MRWALAIPLLASAVEAQTSSTPDTAPLVRFGPSLVQIDAVVTGRDGRRITTLTADDFEVLQDGKPQTITQFSSADAPARRIAILVDDIYMPLADHQATRRALARFIDEQLSAEDRMAVVYTSHGSSALRQFTADASLLHRALDEMYWKPPASTPVAFPGMSLAGLLTDALWELGSLPGRKALVVIAPAGRTQLADVRGLADRAGRAAVVVYTIEAGGTQSSPSEDTWAMLASATGGLALHDSSAAFDQLREAWEDARSYYLIGWNPGADAFHAPPNRIVDYHRVQIRARDKSMRVRTRAAYAARAGTPMWPTAEPLLSPFHGGDLEVRLTAWFDRQQAAGSYVRSLIHIDAKGLRFEPDGDGCRKARLEISRALWAVDPGIPQSDRINSQPLNVRACGGDAELMRREGLIAAAEDRVPTPGAYQVRVAVRNAGAEEVGTATQFLAIPDLKRGGLTIAGLTMWSGNAPAAPEADVSYRLPDPGDPGVRRFRTGDEVHYGFRILGGTPTSEVRLRILRDGQEVYGLARAPMEGVLPLAGLAPGSYLLGVVASGGTTRKPLRAEEWLSFTVFALEH